MTRMVLFGVVWLWATVAAAQSSPCIFTWSPVTTYTDGTPTTITGYRLYKAPPTGVSIKGQFTFEIPVTQLPKPATPEVVYNCQVGEVWRVTAYQGAGTTLMESAFSNSYTVVQMVAKPAGFVVTPRLPLP